MTDIPPTNDGLATTTREPALEDVDQGQKPPYILTFAEVKLLGIAGVRLFFAHHSIYH